MSMASTTRPQAGMADATAQGAPMSDTTTSDPTAPPGAGARPLGRFDRLAGRGWWSATTLVWTGIVVAAAGFVLIAVAWGQIAATLNVGLQMPWLVSAGFTGLGVILVGLTIVNAAVRHQDAVERRRQLEAIERALAEVLAVLHEPDDYLACASRWRAGARAARPRRGQEREA
jgi:hypothetical protein